PLSPGPSGEPATGFYRVVRNGVHLFGITNGATLSGTATLPVEAGYVEGDPLETAILSANGLPIADLPPLSQPFPNMIAFTLDTTRLANGTYNLQPSARWRVPYTNTFEFQTVKLNGV